MTRRPSVRGEVPLPGATEQLLQATKPPAPRVVKPLSAYLAISVLVSPDGEVRVHKLALDSGSGHLITELLDSYQQPVVHSLSPLGVINYWAHQLALDELD